MVECFATMPELRKIALDPFVPTSTKLKFVESLLAGSGATEVRNRRLSACCSVLSKTSIEAQYSARAPYAMSSALFMSLGTLLCGILAHLLFWHQLSQVTSRLFKSLAEENCLAATLQVRRTTCFSWMHCCWNCMLFMRVGRP